MRCFEDYLSFKEQIPSKVALVEGGSRLSYHNLDQQTDRISRSLREEGIGPNTIVGLYFETSIELIIGMVSVLRAGAAFLTIDPKLPLSRKRNMVSVSDAEFILSAADFSGQLETIGECKILLIDDLLQTAARSEKQDNAHKSEIVGKDDLAYLIFTSGTTGDPKAIEVTRSNLLFHCQVFRERCGMASKHIGGLFFDPSFDGALEIIFGLLFSGGTLILLQKAELGIDKINSHVEKHSMTFLDMTTSLWSSWIEYLEREGTTIPGSVEKVVVGGETVYSDNVSIWRSVSENGAGVDLHITYGPTETTIIATELLVDDHMLANNGTLCDGLIGKALPGARVYIVGDELKSVDNGDAGEICIGGPLVARGYRNDEQMTIESFVPDPFTEENGQRMYRTGDIGRFLEDGNIQFLGRKDRQIKLRGFRVDLNEIERVSLAQDGVIQAYAFAESNMQVRTQAIVLCLRFGEQSDSGETEILSALRRELPSYMVPSRVERFDRFPRTLLGKVDFQLLEDEASSRRIRLRRREDRHDYIAAVTEMFEAVIGCRNLSAQDDFFESGGHSILVMEVLVNIQDIYGVKLEMKTFYQNSTIEELAGALKGKLELVGNNLAIN